MVEYDTCGALSWSLRRTPRDKEGFVTLDGPMAANVVGKPHGATKEGVQKK